MNSILIQPCFGVKSYTQCILLIRYELINIVNTNQTLQRWAQNNGVVYAKIVQIMDGTIQYHYNAELIKQILTKIGYQVILQQSLFLNIEASYLLKRQLAF